MGMKKRELAAFAGKVKGLRQGFGGFMRETARTVGEEYLGSVRAASPVDEGRLKDSWMLNETADGVRVENHAEHAFFVEHGHRTASGGWVEGRHFQESCEAALEESLPEEVGRRLEDFVKKAL